MRPMRVIAGRARRIELKVAPGSSTRPFLEMARGALFNALAARVGGAAVLDCYAGSGALGIEALSRMARRCVFIEADPRAVAVLKENLERCGCVSEAEVRAGSVQRMIAGVRGPFDLIFVDPPFAAAAAWGEAGAGQAVMRATGRLLGPRGRLCFRFEHERVAAPAWPGLHLVRDRRYGRSRVCLYGPGEDDGKRDVADAE